MCERLRGCNTALERRLGACAKIPTVGRVGQVKRGEVHCTHFRHRTNRPNSSSFRFERGRRSKSICDLFHSMECKIPLHSVLLTWMHACQVTIALCLPSSRRPGLLSLLAVTSIELQGRRSCFSGLLTADLGVHARFYSMVDVFALQHSPFGTKPTTESREF